MSTFEDNDGRPWLIVTEDHLDAEPVEAWVKAHPDEMRAKLDQAWRAGDDAIGFEVTLPVEVSVFPVGTERPDVPVTETAEPIRL